MNNKFGNSKNEKWSFKYKKVNTSFKNKVLSSFIKIQKKKDNNRIVKRATFSCSFYYFRTRCYFVKLKNYHIANYNIEIQ